jgi:hypothetical protein
MGSPHSVDGDGRIGEALRDGPRGAGVIEVDMCDDDPVEVVDAVAFEPSEDVIDRALGPGLDESRLLAAYDESSRDPLGSMHLRIDDQRFVHSPCSPCG